MPSLSHSSVPAPRTNITRGGAEHRHERAAVALAGVERWTLTADHLLVVADDHRADPGVGEDLEQQHVGNPPVEDVSPAHTVAHGVHAAAHLRDHPAGDRAVGS